MKKVLILNGSYSEIPLIEVINKLGYYSVVLGKNTNAMGNSVANKYIPCDYSDKEAVLNIAKREGVCAVISGCTDFSILTTSYVCEKLGFAGHDSYATSEILHLKDKYRKLARELGIKTPNVVRYEKNMPIDMITGKLSFPVIVKPVDLTTGYGMTKCSHINELLPALNFALQETRKNYVIVEEFIEGTNHGFSAFIQDKKVTFYFVDNEQHTLNKYAVSGASTTTKIPKRAIEQLIKDCEKIANHLNLADGILHTQFILDSNHVPTILEVTRRAPGDLYIKFVEYATGVNYPELIVKSEMGIKVPILSQQKPLYNLVRHCIMGNKNGILDCVKIDKSIEKNIKHLIQWWQAGELIENKELYKAGIAFVFFDSEKEMEDTIPKLNSLISIELKEKVGV